MSIKKLTLVTLVFGILLVMSCQNQGQQASASSSTEQVTNDSTADTANLKERAEGRATTELIRRLEKRVTLTEEQKKTIRSIALKFDFDNLPVEQRRINAGKINTIIRQEVLTPEQIEIMKAGLSKEEE